MTAPVDEQHPERAGQAAGEDDDRVLLRAAVGDQLAELLERYRVLSSTVNGERHFVALLCVREHEDPDGVRSQGWLLVPLTVSDDADAATVLGLGPFRADQVSLTLASLAQEALKHEAEAHGDVAV